MEDMTYVYEATVDVDESGCYYVEVPQLQGVFAGGETLAEAYGNVAVNMQLVIADMLERGEPLPEPEFSDPAGPAVCVAVDEVFIQESKCLTVSEAAEELGVSPGRVSQLLDSGGLVPLVVDGRRLVTIASVNERKATPRRAGRPRKEATLA